MKTLFSSLFILFISFSYAQTCTSSGGDDVPDIDDHPYRLRCGTAMMHDMKKVSKDYKIIKTCDNYAAEGNYFKKGNQLFYSPTYGEFELMPKANHATFRCENGTAMDDKNIFYRGKVVTNIDKASFKTVGKVYCKDNNSVYFKDKYADSGTLIGMPHGKSAHFELIGDANSYYAKDDKMVYFYGKPIENADPNSFEILTYGYSHDNNYAYYNGKRIEGMKGATFSVLKDCFLGTDGISLCNTTNRLENSDAKSFKAIECGYYKDNNNVYLNGSILENVDSPSFEILTWGYTKDKDAVYCDLKPIVGADPTTFEVLARKHAKDHHNIFYLQQKMDCDYASFKIDATLDYLSSDKSHQYSRGQRIN